MGIRTVEAVNGILVENTSVGVETLAAGDVAAHRVKHHCTVHTRGQGVMLEARSSLPLSRRVDCHTDLGGVA